MAAIPNRPVTAVRFKDALYLDPALAGRRYLNEIRFLPILEEQSDIRLEHGLAAFDREVVMRLAVCHEGCEFASRQQRIGGNVLAPDVDALQQRNEHADFIGLLGFAPPSLYGQSTDPSAGSGQAFLGDAQSRLVAYDAHDVRLPPRFVNGVAHRLALNREALVFLPESRIPLLQGEIELDRINPDQHIPDVGFSACFVIYNLH